MRSSVGVGESGDVLSRLSLFFWYVLWKLSEVGYRVAEVYKQGVRSDSLLYLETAPPRVAGG